MSSYTTSGASHTSQQAVPEPDGSPLRQCDMWPEAAPSQQLCLEIKFQIWKRIKKFIKKVIRTLKRKVG